MQLNNLAKALVVYLFMYLCADRPKVRLPRFLRQRYVANVGDKINLTIPFTVSQSSPSSASKTSSLPSVLFYPRANPNLSWAGRRTESPWTRRGSTSAAQRETASCSSVRPREKTPERTRCVWRWRTLRTKRRSSFRSSVNKLWRLLMHRNRENANKILRRDPKRVSSFQNCRGLLPAWRSWIPGALTLLWSGPFPATMETRRSPVTQFRRPTKRLEWV